MELAVSIRALVAGRHFLADADPRDVGHKCIAANLSNMAATGATPRWATLALTLQQADQWLEDFARGFLDLAADHAVDLIGTDTAPGPLTVCVQIMGEVRAGRALRRSGARPGDDLWLSGTVGDAALALAHLRGDFRLHAHDLDYALKRLTRPRPRVELGKALVGLATSAIDIPDGLVEDVGHIASNSGARALLRWESIPLSSVAARYREYPLVRQAALAGGGDYELAFTAPAGVRKAIDALAGRLGVGLARIGVIEAGAGVAVLDRRAQPIALAKTGCDGLH